MITTTTSSCISVIHDICSCKITEIQEAVVVMIIWWCDLQLHRLYITEIQGAILVVIIWLCDLQLHMSYSNEIQEAVVVVIISLYFSNI
jgi:hypothetical protein